MVKYNIPRNPTQSDFDKAYSLGLIPKSSLVDGAYYKGFCRNTTYARWHEASHVFVYWRTKFDQRFLEEIKHPVDDQVYDVFFCVEKVDSPPQDAIIDDEKFLKFVEF